MSLSLKEQTRMNAITEIAAQLPAEFYITSNRNPKAIFPVLRIKGAEYIVDGSHRQATAQEVDSYIAELEKRTAEFKAKDEDLQSQKMKLTQTLAMPDEVITALTSQPALLEAFTKTMQAVIERLVPMTDQKGKKETKQVEN